MSSAHHQSSRALLLAALLALALFAGCSGGTSDGGEIGGGGGLSGGSGGNTPPDPDPGADPTPVPSLSATLSWSAASGPVAGYRVLVSRNDGGFSEETQTSTASVVVAGMQGDVVRVRVAAFDALGNTGPMSTPSEPFVFVGAQSTTSAASSGDASAAGSNSSDSASTLAAGGGNDGATLAGDSGATDGSGTTADAGTDAGASAAGSSPGDLDGDGASDLVWESPDATLVRITSADLTRARLYALPAGGWRVAALGDFDADGVSDLLFAAQDELALARGSALRAGPGDLSLEVWAQLPAGARLAAAGDFDADGAADAAVLEAGAVTLLLANGDALALGAPIEGAQIAGAGDADGDGSDDLLWAGTEGISLWRIAAGAPDATPVTAPEGAVPLAFADFDGDGAAELALRSAPDAISLSQVLPPFAAWLEPAPSDATLAGCGDYDGDGTRDRLWADAASLRVVSAGGEQQVALDAASPWRLFHDCR